MVAENWHSVRTKFHAARWACIFFFVRPTHFREVRTKISFESLQLYFSLRFRHLIYVSYEFIHCKWRLAGSVHGQEKYWTSIDSSWPFASLTKFCNHIVRGRSLRSPKRLNLSLYYNCTVFFLDGNSFFLSLANVVAQKTVRVNFSKPGIQFPSRVAKPSVQKWNCVPKMGRSVKTRNIAKKNETKNWEFQNPTFRGLSRFAP